MEIRHVTGSGRGWVLARSGGIWSTNASQRDVETAREAAERRGTPVFFYRLGPHEWIVDDPALVGRLEAAIQPLVALARRQAEMAAEQAALAARHGEAGLRMAQAGLAMCSADLAAAMKRMHDARATMEAVAHEQQELAAKQQATGDEQQAAQRQADTAIDTIMEDAIVEGVARDPLE